MKITEKEERVLDNLGVVECRYHGSFNLRFFLSTNNEPVTRAVKSLIKKGVLEVYYPWTGPVIGHGPKIELLPDYK